METVRDGLKKSRKEVEKLATRNRGGRRRKRLGEEWETSPIT